MKKVAEVLGYSDSDTKLMVAAWKELMISFGQDQGMCQRLSLKLDSGHFWSRVLDEGAISSEILIKLIRHVMSLPTGNLCHFDFAK